MEAKSGIHIKKSHRGLLHKNLGVKQGEPIPASKLAIKSTDSPAVKKRKQFAINAKKWHHAQVGDQLEGPQLTPINTPNYNWMANGYQNPMRPAASAESMMQTDNSGESNPFQAYPIKKKRGKWVIDDKNTDWSKIGQGLVVGLSALDALLPGERVKHPVVQPLQSYNPYQYGTGSQAIAEHGIKLSKSGYRRNSPDVNEPMLQIPSNQIDMTGVDFPVYGQDNAGMGKLMMPGEKHEFVGDYVNEVPIREYQGGMHLKNGGCMDCGGKMNMGGGFLAEQQLIPNEFFPSSLRKSEWGGVIPNMFHNNTGKIQEMAADGEMLGSKNDDEAKSGGWIKGAINPKHKGWCTPMSKPTCTGHRRALALTFKKHHGFHKKDDGGDLPVLYEEGKTYDLSDSEIKKLVAAGYTIKMM